MDRICDGEDGGLVIYFKRDEFDTQEFITIEQKELKRLGDAISKRIYPITNDDCRV